MAKQIFCLDATYITVKSKKQGEELADKLAELFYKYDKDFEFEYDCEETNEND